MRIALGQLESGADIRANLAAIDRFTAEAARDGSALVAFPEYATCEKKKVDATFPQVAEPLDGPVCKELAAIARHRPAGFLPEDPPFRRAGLRGVHVHQAAGPSTDPVVFEHGGVRFGLMTCYDLRFPELARSLADAGA